jgi:hypothetical protein
MLGGYTFEPGDSGSPVFDSAERLVGMINICELDNTRTFCIPTGYGTDAFAIKNVLRFDAWDGTQTVPDRTIGIFRPGPHQWFMDNGNNKLDACGADPRYNDICMPSFGSTGERPVVGNWTGRGVYTVGQYRIGVFSPAINSWILDTTGNGTYDDCTLPTGDWCPHLSISQSTDLPVVGDWNGDGKMKLGQFRPSTAQWFLDWNGNGVWDGCGTDRCYTFGQAGDQPIVGGWSGNGITKIGVFRNGTWELDVSGNGSYGTGDRSAVYGIAGDRPVAGNWSGTPGSKIGVFRYERGQGTWFLDGSGSFTFEGCATDMCYVYGAQASGDLPVIWGPSTVKAN